MLSTFLSLLLFPSLGEMQAADERQKRFDDFINTHRVKSLCIPNYLLDITGQTSMTIGMFQLVCERRRDRLEETNYDVAVISQV